MTSTSLAPTAPLRVVQWTTGIVGRAALRALIDDPRFELVGVHAHSADKVGVDAGEIAERPTTGVAVTATIDAVLALAPDCVVYMPQWPVIDELEVLLGAGINVVTTARIVDGTHYPDGAGARLTAAAARGGSTLLGTGMNPMYVSTVALAATAMCSRVTGLRVLESMDCGLYGGAGTWEAYGFGTPAEPERIRRHLLDTEPDYFEALDQLAAAVGARVDAHDVIVELATANEDRDLGYMTIAAGTVSAIDARWLGLIDGEPFVEMRTTWKLGSVFGYTDTPDWDLLFGYRLDIRGEPNVRVQLSFMPDDFTTFDIGTGTALPAVNAIPAVCAAAPGVLGVADLPLITGVRR